MQKIAYADVIKHIKEMLGPAAEERGVKLKTEVIGKENYSINTDKQILGIILECLVANAINYSSSGQEIVLDIRKEGEYFIFSVKDSGIGIPKEEQDRIFERFYRAANAKTFKPDGTGLGLNLAQMLAQRIGAKITFESEVGRGSIFYLRIPRG